MTDPTTNSASREPVFRDEIVVPDSAIDTNEHVNNVVYVQWMQDVAVRHFSSIVSLRSLREEKLVWVVRSHHVEYFSPAFVGDQLRLLTWIVNFSRVRSLRRYKFIRESDNKLIVKGETDWVMINAETGRPSTIPDHVRNAFETVPEDVDP